MTMSIIGCVWRQKEQWGMHLNSLYCEIVVTNTDAEFIDETEVRRSKADRRNLLSGALSQELKNN